MNKPDYSRGSLDVRHQNLNVAQSLCVAASIFLAVASAIVGWVFQLDDTASLVCYVLFLLSDTALAIMLLSWRRRIDWALLVVGWLWVTFGLYTLVIALGEQSGLLRE